MDIPLKFQLIW